MNSFDKTNNITLHSAQTRTGPKTASRPGRNRTHIELAKNDSDTGGDDQCDGHRWYGQLVQDRVQL